MNATEDVQTLEIPPGRWVWLPGTEHEIFLINKPMVGSGTIRRDGPRDGPLRGWVLPVASMYLRPVGRGRSAVTTHQPTRPGWVCVACTEPWPCRPARGYLRRTFGLLRTALLMGDDYGRACADLATVAPGELYQRFLGWVRP